MTWLQPPVLEGFRRAFAAASPTASLLPQAAEAISDRAAAASAHMGALAAVLHYLATYSEAVRLQCGNLQELTQRVAASGLLLPSSASQIGEAPQASDAGVQWHPLVPHALACVRQHSERPWAGYPASVMIQPACVEMLDGLLSLVRALEDIDPCAALSGALSAATDQQAGFVPLLVMDILLHAAACDAHH